MIPKSDIEREDTAEPRGPGEPAIRRRYEAPRLVKKRAVSRATLFTGGGPDSAGVIG